LLQYLTVIFLCSILEDVMRSSLAQNTFYADIANARQALLSLQSETQTENNVSSCDYDAPSSQVKSSKW